MIIVGDINTYFDETTHTYPINIKVSAVSQEIVTSYTFFLQDSKIFVYFFRTWTFT